ncbi:MAG: TolB-like translocation protein, partial [Anaerolineae bacterium]
MGKGFRFLVALAAVMLVTAIAMPASGQISGVPSLTVDRAAGKRRVASLADAEPDAVADTGVIAYVRPSTGDIHLISPEGSGDRVLWTAPRPLSADPAYELAWRPDGRELAFSSGHELACSWYDSDVYTISYGGAGYRRVTNSPACAELAGLPKGSVTVEV